MRSAALIGLVVLEVACSSSKGPAKTAVDCTAMGAHTGVEGAKTGVTTGVEGVKTFGKAVGGLVQGGRAEAKQKWNAGKADTKRTAHEGAADTRKAAHSSQCP